MELRKTSFSLVVPHMRGPQSARTDRISQAQRAVLLISVEWCSGLEAVSRRARNGMREASPSDDVDPDVVQGKLPGRSRAGLRTAVLILTATAVPVVGLFWASGVARSEFEHCALGGLVATGKATVLQEQQAWDDAARIVSAAALGATLVGGLQSHNAEMVQQGAQNALITGPFADVRIYDAMGNLVATAAVPAITPTAVDLADPRPIGDPVMEGGKTLRQIRAGIAVPSIGPALGRLVVDVDVTQLLGKSADLAFGQTGTKSLVTPAGMVVAGSAAVGTPLRSSANLAIAAAGKPVTTIVYSPFYHRMTVEAYEPIPAQKMASSSSRRAPR